MADLLFEIGCEELPAGYSDPALAFMKVYCEKGLHDLGLSFDQIETKGTPRRLVLMIKGLVWQQADRHEEVMGPKAELAFAADGSLTAAGAAFVKARGARSEDAFRKSTPKGEVIALKLEIKGALAAELLPGLLSQILKDMPFPKRMRWDESGVSFARPIRWILSLLDGEVLPLRFGFIESSNQSCGHRFMAPDFFAVESIEDYTDKLEKSFVMLDGQARKEAIVEGAQALATELGGALRHDPVLLETVKNLVEYPWPLLGHFEADFLKVPKAILICEMREHQKYFAIEDAAGNLMPHFVVVAGSAAQNDELVAQGHARVLRARFEDGAFYFREDSKNPLSFYADKLKTLLFQRELGSVADKAKRMEMIALQIGALLNLSSEQLADLQEAARLCKADLTTGVVLEFPALQGVMGSIYAQASGSSAAAACAIEDHYLPRFSEDVLPRTDLAACLALADRLDTLVGICGIGRMPKGSADPFALRRAGIAIARILFEKAYACSLEALLGFAIEALGDTLKQPKEEVLSLCADFVKTRARGLLLDDAKAQGEEDAVLVIEAVMARGADNLADLGKRLQVLMRMRREDKEAFANLCATFKRASNIVQKARGEGFLTQSEHIEISLLQVKAEQDLQQALLDLHFDNQAPSEQDYTELLNKIAALRPLVDRFFEDVMVMDENMALRQARLALLAKVEHLSAYLADFRVIAA